MIKSTDSRCPQKNLQYSQAKRPYHILKEVFLIDDKFEQIVCQPCHPLLHFQEINTPINILYSKQALAKLTCLVVAALDKLSHCTHPGVPFITSDPLTRASL